MKYLYCTMKTARSNACRPSFTNIVYIAIILQSIFSLSSKKCCDVIFSFCYNFKKMLLVYLFKHTKSLYISRSVKLQHTYIHTYIYIHTYLHTWIHTWLHTYIYAYIHAYIHILRKYHYSQTDIAYWLILTIVK